MLRRTAQCHSGMREHDLHVHLQQSIRELQQQPCRRLRD
jgi:hypothetical protein